jgi:hypothetical protein
VTSKRQQGRNIGEIIVLGMPKATPDADDESAQLARMERLCSALDVVREESERLYHEITPEARRANAAITTGKLARGLVMRTVNRRQRPRLRRDRAE